MVLLHLLLACVPPDPPVRSLVDVPLAPPRALALQTEEQAWLLVRDTLAGEGLPRLEGTDLAFSERVGWSDSEGTTVVTRRFLSGPDLARERLAELGLDLSGWREAELWEAYQALSLGTLAFELSRVVARERGAEGVLDEAVDLPRAAALERATLHLLAGRGQIPAGWPEAAGRLVCALEEAEGGSEVYAEARCAASKLPPAPVSALVERYAPAPLDLFAALLSAPAEGAEGGVAGLAGAGLRWTRVEDTLRLTPADGSWSMALVVGEGRDTLDGSLTLPLRVDAAARPRLLELANALNLSLDAEGVVATLLPDGLALDQDGWPVGSPLSSVELATRLSRLAVALSAALPGVMAGAEAPAAAAERVHQALLDDTEAP